MSGERANPGGNKTSRRSAKGVFLPSPETQERASLVLARYESGELIEKIAKDLKITHQAAYKGLLKYCSDDWRDSQVARAMAEYEKAKNAVAEIGSRKRLEKYDAQSDQVALACAREQLRSAQWELERLCARLFAQKQEVKLDINVDLAGRLIRARERVIHNDAVQLPQRSGDAQDAEVVETGTKS